MLCAFDNFLDRLEKPLPDPKTKRVVEAAANAQAACTGLTMSCARFAVLSTLETMGSLLKAE